MEMRLKNANMTYMEFEEKQIENEEWF